MKILIENYRYGKHTEETAVYKALKGTGLVNDLELEALEPICVEYVGYVYNRELDDVVFCLPKVVLTGINTREGDEILHETVFGLTPEELVDFDNIKQSKDKEVKTFLSELAIWIYRSITIFREHNPNSLILKSADYSNTSKGRHASRLYTLFDVVLALRDFNREHQNYLMFVTRANHSGNNKILWNKTISKTTAIMKSGAPVYVSPINKKNEINFEEELLVIYYSILNHIKRHYGFNFTINANYPLITGEQFNAYCDNGKGKRRLKAIKYKYFSDNALKLWNLCYAYFDQRHDISIKKHKQDYLLVHSFQIVFEHMIDELLGDKYFEKGFKEQRDKKRVDHLFIYDSLVQADIDQKKYNTYYISDSKYYSRKELKELREQKDEDSTPMTGIHLQDKDVYKQFTYARNVVQCNMDLFFGDPKNDIHPQMRPDSLTEGYNVIPNFFISAYIPTEEDENTVGERNLGFDFKNDRLQATGTIEFNRHFDNRLFDRDTLLLSYYNINFLFVVSLFGRDNKANQISWRNSIRETFKKNVQDELNRLYTFSILRPKYINWQDYIKLHFHELNGKIFRPDESRNYLIMALLKSDDESKALLDKYHIDFRKVEEDKKLITRALSDMFDKQDLNQLQDIRTANITDLPLLNYKSDISPIKCIIINRESKAFENTRTKIQKDPRFGVAIQTEINEKGKKQSVLHLDEGLASIAYLVITNKVECDVYNLKKGPIFLLATDMKDVVTTKDGAQIYLSFDIELSNPFPSRMIDVEKVKKIFRNGHGPEMANFGDILIGD